MRHRQQRLLGVFANFPQVGSRSPVFEVNTQMFGNYCLGFSPGGVVLVQLGSARRCKKNNFTVTTQPLLAGVVWHHVNVFRPQAPVAPLCWGWTRNVIFPRLESVFHEVVKNETGFHRVSRGCGLCLVRASLAHQQISVSKLMQMERWDQYFVSCQASFDWKHTQTPAHGSKHFNFHRTQKTNICLLHRKGNCDFIKTKCQTGFWAFSL